ncbi:MAG: bifunctional adenosylcobinamide kinase/adenosylcobinamide-phosphate guanylyltransferase [Alphaproteobacteria bacterium]|nr:bifunctional adenosylcobinamide kinase/adenosylcobinamide-phosphate guanylyltransferase [Alphaproteobacteria bacterium]
MTQQGITLYLGGARSGKSMAAEHCALTLAADTGQLPYYLATGQAFDDEMKARIARHKDLRQGQFQTIEEPVDLAKIINSLAYQTDSKNSIILIDSVGIWLTNLMLAEKDWSEPLDETIAAITDGGHHAVFVSDDVGGGIIPENAMARQFRDHMGLINQRIASAAKHVYFVIAGIETKLK